MDEPVGADETDQPSFSQQSQLAGMVLSSLSLSSSLVIVGQRHQGQGDRGGRW